MHSPLDWDDMRVVLAVAREGSLSGAARRLRVTHSTVFRRLAAIEQTLGATLFERFRDGYVATAAGEAAVTVAERLEDELTAFERRLSGQDMRPSGAVRIATADTILPLVIQYLPEFRANYPDIVPEIAISNAMANLTRREADIAIRPVPEPPEHLIGRRIADIAHAIYASPAYSTRNGGFDSKDQDWIWLEDAEAPTVIGRWLRQNVRPDRVALTVNALSALHHAVRMGLGLAVLPCYIGDCDGTLQRWVGQTPETPRSALWLLTHDDLRRSARIRVTMDFFATALSRDRTLFEGERRVGEAVAVNRAGSSGFG